MIKAAAIRFSIIFLVVSRLQNLCCQSGGLISPQRACR
jgi:hypothetical protein